MTQRQRDWPDEQAKFVQLVAAATDGESLPHLYALDEDGRVWVYARATTSWERMSGKREMP